MGETKKKDQPMKRRRQLCSLGKSSSDSEITRAKGKERWPFPQNLTVDELARYRRRRVQGRPKDTLCRTEGSLGNLITEYRRAFRASSEDVRNISKLIGTDQSGIPVKSTGGSCNLTVADDRRVMEARTESSRFIPHLNASGRPPQIRRGTSLKREGKFSSDTEQSCYVAHEGNHRAELARRPTSLKMEGDMCTTSENCEKFIEWLNVSRPELARLPTHLKLEGELDISTENHEKYVPFVGARRPEILRQNANLRMEGESRYLPEYQEVFKDHNIRGRRTLKKPETHLRTEGNFYNTTETSEQFVNPRSILEMNLDNDIIQKSDTDDEEDEELTMQSRENNNIERLDDVNDIKGPPLEIPEYRDAFKDFPRERPKLMKPGDEIGRSDGSKVTSSPARSKFNTKIDMDPEYKSKFLDLSKESPVYRKPPLALRPSAVAAGLSHSMDRNMRRNVNGVSPQRGKRSASSTITGINEHNYHNNDNVRQRLFEATSEVKSQYVPYGNIPRVESIKMPTNLQLEGNIDLQPEYRSAYCRKRDYQIPTNEPRMHRRRERSSSESRRRDNYWTDNNNGENFGRINANEDQDAFQILQTRVHEDSIVGKPPSGINRRGSLISRPAGHVADVTDPSILRKRSPSPSYRLHVCNVDDEPRGFRRQLKQMNDSQISRSDNDNVNEYNYSRRLYSPSFGRASAADAGPEPADKSFIVLQDNNLNNQNHQSVAGDRNSFKYGSTHPAAGYRGRNRPDVNHNAYIDIGTKNKIPQNWMRPWYDNGTTENIGTEAIIRVTHWLRSIWEMRRRGGPVQQWVDSIPSYGTSTSSFTSRQTGESSETKETDSTILENRNNSGKDISFLDRKTVRKTKDMTASAPIVIPNSPAITMACASSSVPHSRLARDPSLQSDSSHCSSVESLLELRRADPEAILLGLGFGYPNSPQENGSLARIPRRFLQPSKLKGIAVDDFLKQQQQSSESLDSASLGYRGLTGSPYVAPSEIVQKIMERLREHESHEIDSYTTTNSNSDLFGSMQQDGRLSVLSPDNRQYLEQPRSKSPDMRNKRMIIGEKSFAFGYNGDLIEVESSNNIETLNAKDKFNNYPTNMTDSTLKLVNGFSTSSQTEKPGKLPSRRLAKQFSFDEDNSNDRADIGMGFSQDHRDSVATIISRWSMSNEAASKLVIPNRFDKTKLNSASRRASDSIYDSKLRTNDPTSIEERRMSDSGIETKVQESEGKKKIMSDKKPFLKRQARVSEADSLPCEMEDVTTIQNLSSVATTSIDNIDDYVSEDEKLRVEYNDDKPNDSWNINTSEESDDSKIASKMKQQMEIRKICCFDGNDKCCKVDESSKIYNDEKTSTECCCLTGSSKCWRKMSKVMSRNKKLEHMVAKSRQEMAELRAMLNNALSVRTEPQS